MPNTLLLNNTGAYHLGCAKVIETFEFDDSIPTNTPFVADYDYSQYSNIILNGEGTMHHDRPNAVKFLDALRKFQQAGCETHIANSVWDGMSNKWDDVLINCKSIVVRDVLSQRQLLDNHNVSSTISPDRSIIPDVPYEKYNYTQVYQGQWFHTDTQDTGFPKLNVFKQPWNEIVNRLRHCDLLVTGRHHEAYAAIKAKCNFIVLTGNTHKNEGIYLNAGVEPINKLNYIEDALNGKYDSQFKELHDYYQVIG
jgi:hypothetical protein